MITVESHVFNAFQVNTYLVRDEEGNCLVVDPAFYSPEEEARFDAYISENGLKLTGQINTHCHVDHILGVKHLQQNYNLPLRAHQNESGLLNNAPLMGEIYGLKVEPINGIDEEVSDNDLIPLNGVSLHAILVPGHSPGSLSFYSPEGGFVITGDALFQGSIGRTDLPGGDYDTLIHAIRNRLLTLPPGTIVYPGHGDPSSIGNEAIGNPFLTMVE
ncbi:MAG: MBL fold metallo-hydrolase [Bacteroidia bacterium]|nr:MAG: MBL fold metallo-hydrolase [Bacteroidia bacterium]